MWSRANSSGSTRTVRTKKTITLLSVTFEGLLTVTDELCFRQTLLEGLGRGKAFGMGLLTVIRPIREKNKGKQ